MKFSQFKTDHMKLLPHMQNIGDEIMNAVLKERESYKPEIYTKDDVLAALESKICTLENLKALLSPAASEFLEQIALLAMKKTRANFGINVSVFTPLYIANHCDNLCVYCGFNSKNNIQRAKLSESEIEAELKEIAKTGLEDILILTGESETNSDINYIAKACKIAKRYFKIVGVEVYPVNSTNYALLHKSGVDYVTVFQETYNPSKYEKLHLAGNKRIFPYRLNAQERALMGGMRGVGFAALLGLDDFRLDAFSTALHASLVQKKYPHAEIAFSVPRLRPIINNSKINPRGVRERELLQVICAYRIFMPSANITISTRERALFRDNAVKIAANKISAGVNVGIGAHSDNKKGDEQFEIEDSRSVDEICAMIRAQGLEPLMSEYIYV
ncbi:2-iminoacetate synthase ThiH [Campylobacter sp. RM12920]|uniref:2-iminoacetate synthase ThiH n=1 Tax=Campylobacter californiensis TaxID=1032243 RepID=A0ABD4JGX2_9BACT|nr:2-iminoacetate synthase ThiH [Campylobacter sp. RM12919]MBE2988340.1 2-iminoacetate synthase ThiH [Campylobacter sp. RM12920]